MFYNSSSSSWYASLSLAALLNLLSFISLQFLLPHASFLSLFKGIRHSRKYQAWLARFFLLYVISAYLFYRFAVSLLIHFVFLFFFLFLFIYFEFKFCFFFVFCFLFFVFCFLFFVFCFLLLFLFFLITSRLTHLDRVLCDGLFWERHCIIYERECNRGRGRRGEVRFSVRWDFGDMKW